MANFVIEHALEGAKYLLSPFENGIDFLETEDYYENYYVENTLETNVVIAVEEDYFQEEDIIDERLFGAAKLPRASLSGIDNRIDNRHDGAAVVEKRVPTPYSARRAADIDVNDPNASLSLEQRGFILSDALNFEPGGFLILNLFEGEAAKSHPSLRRVDLAVSTLSFFFAHELGHTLGLVHTGTGDKTIYDSFPDESQKVSAAREDIMYQGLRRSDQELLLVGEEKSVEFSNPDTLFKTTGESFRIALGLEWNTQDTENALDYFNAYFFGNHNVA